jgi:hypothetical protein
LQMVKEEEEEEEEGIMFNHSVFEETEDIF